jgi:hypothetical protein
MRPAPDFTEAGLGVLGPGSSRFGVPTPGRATGGASSLGVPWPAGRRPHARLRRSRDLDLVALRTTPRTLEAAALRPKPAVIATNVKP